MDDSKDDIDIKRVLTEEEKQKKLAQVICICKGIPLRTIIKALDGSQTIADVNRKTGSGSGGCQGERCGPKIRILLKKKREQEKDVVKESKRN